MRSLCIFIVLKKLLSVACQHHPEKSSFVREGGRGGIRTPGTLSRTPVFKTGAINQLCHSSELLLLSERGKSIIYFLIKKENRVKKDPILFILNSSNDSSKDRFAISLIRMLFRLK